MTSGHFTSFPVEQIYVDRAERQRRELTGIEALAESIQRTGLINPPVIERDGKLVAGERRWTAIKTLGWTHVPVQFADELSPLELHILEFEENVRRQDLPWQDRCAAVERYNALKAEQDPEWTQTDTAQALGLSPSEVTEQIAVAKELVKGNARVADADKFSTARGIVRREQERKKSSILTGITLPGVKPEPEDETPSKVPPLLHADFAEWAPTYDGARFNFIHCDFPYGVGMHKSDQGSGKSFGTYADGKDVYWDLLGVLKSAMDNVVAESAHLMFWFSMDYYADTKTLLEAMGWKINPFPLMWMKDDNTGIVPDANRQPRRIYETAFFGSRGDRLIISPVSNAFAAPGRDKSIHMNEKPVVMLKHFMRMFVDEYSLVLDPTAGSANALKSAERLGANHVLGLERDKEFFDRAVEAYYGDQ